MGRLLTGSLLSFFDAPQDQHAILPGGLPCCFFRWSDGSNLCQKHSLLLWFLYFLKLHRAGRITVIIFHCMQCAMGLGNESVSPPQRQKEQWRANKYDQVGMLAGGVGITPMLQIIREVRKGGFQGGGRLWVRVIIFSIWFLFYWFCIIFPFFIGLNFSGFEASDPRILAEGFRVCTNIPVANRLTRATPIL